MRLLEVPRLHIKRWMKGFGIVGILLAPFAFIALMNSWFAFVNRVEPHYLYDRAAVIQSDESDPRLLPAQGWKTVKLPNRTVGNGTVPTSLWYRVELDIAEPQNELWAVYLPRTGANYALYINDDQIADGGSMERAVPLHLEPLFFEFSGRMLHAGKNVVAIRVVRASASGALGATQIGPSKVLAPIYRAAYFLKTTLMQITVVCMLAVGLIMATLFRLRSRDAVFGWFAVALFFWAAQIAILLRPEPLFGDWRLWINLQCIAIACYVISLSFFINRFVGAHLPRFEKTLTVWGVAGAALLILDPLLFRSSMPWFFSWVWFPPLSMVTIYQEYQLVMSARRKRDVDSMYLAAIGWFVLVNGLRDTAIDMNLLHAGAFYTSYTVGPVLLVFGFILLRRFARAVVTAEHARDELEIRVAQKSAALEENLVRLKDLERERALSAERERIMRDMHDGVGGQLVQVLALAANQPALKPVEEPIRNCLEDLSLIIDSIEPVNGDLGSVLGMLRVRMSHRLEEAGIKLCWEIADIPMLADFGPQRVLQVLRIVQEAIANALKHSRATQIAVRAVLCDADRIQDPAAVAIEVADNGIGMVSARRAGHGLKNMRRRAAELNGRLSVDSCETGTKVRLELPFFAARDVNVAVARS